MKYKLQIIPPLILAALFSSTACQKAPHMGKTIELARSTENNVLVSIALNIAENGQFILSATFTPQEPGLHLYSKDIPKTGVNGLGRPTLLELSKGSKIQAVSELIESVTPKAPPTPPLELLAYPAGPVTLSLYILLPGGNDWNEDEVSVTYMACDERGCRAPVQGKAIAIKIPGKGLVQE